VKPRAACTVPAVLVLCSAAAGAVPWSGGFQNRVEFEDLRGSTVLGQVF